MALTTAFQRIKDYFSRWASLLPMPGNRGAGNRMKLAQHADFRVSRRRRAQRLAGCGLDPGAEGGAAATGYRGAGAIMFR